MSNQAKQRDIDVLSHHYWQERGMSVNSSDTCSCGARTRPPGGGEEAGVRRARAFAVHQAEMLAAARAAEADQ